MRSGDAEAWTRVALAATSFAVALATGAGASQRPGGLKAPIDLSDPVNIEAGRRMFNVTCTHYCHGKDGRGGGMRGPSLRDRGFDNAYLYGRISGGLPPMPAFATIYTPEQIWKIIAYIQSLRD